MQKQSAQTGVTQLGSSLLRGTAARSPADRSVLIDAAMSAGLDPDVAHDVLESGRYADVVRAE